jgi:hypothetical protein
MRREKMTLADKLRALASQADAGREGDVYSTMEMLLRERPWPEWLKNVAAAVDAPKASKDRPINLQEVA